MPTNTLALQQLAHAAQPCLIMLAASATPSSDLSPGPWAPSDLVSSIDADADVLKMHREGNQLFSKASFCQSFLQKLGAVPTPKN